jgi:hypothetical protein
MTLPNPPIAGGEVRGGAWPCAPTPSLGAPKWCRGRACPTLVGLLKLGDGKPSPYTVCRYRRIGVKTPLVAAKAHDVLLWSGKLSAREDTPPGDSHWP